MGERSFAELLRWYRERTGVSQARLARLVGVDHSYVSRLERGERRPSRDLVVRIADALSLPAADASALLSSAGFSPSVLDPEVEALVLLLSDRMVPEEVRSGLRQAIRSAIVLAQRAAASVTEVEGACS